jgi:hypothetical protein
VFEEGSNPKQANEAGATSLFGMKADNLLGDRTFHIAVTTEALRRRFARELTRAGLFNLEERRRVEQLLRARAEEARAGEEARRRQREKAEQEGRDAGARDKDAARRSAGAQETGGRERSGSKGLFSRRGAGKKKQRAEQSTVAWWDNGLSTVELNDATHGAAMLESASLDFNHDYFNHDSEEEEPRAGGRDGGGAMQPTSPRGEGQQQQQQLDAESRVARAGGSEGEESKQEDASDDDDAGAWRASMAREGRSDYSFFNKNIPSPTYLPSYLPAFLPSYLPTYLPAYLPTYPTHVPAWPAKVTSLSTRVRVRASCGRTDGGRAPARLKARGSPTGSASRPPPPPAAAAAAAAPGAAGALRKGCRLCARKAAAATARG